MDGEQSFHVSLIGTSNQLSTCMYTGNLLREKTFLNWWKIRFSGEKFLGFLACTAYCLATL